MALIFRRRIVIHNSFGAKSMHTPPPSQFMQYHLGMFCEFQRNLMFEQSTAATYGRDPRRRSKLAQAVLEQCWSTGQSFRGNTDACADVSPMSSANQRCFISTEELLCLSNGTFAPGLPKRILPQNVAQITSRRPEYFEWKRKWGQRVLVTHTAECPFRWVSMGTLMLPLKQRDQLRSTLNQ
jgi:hypothetical protein